MESKASGDADGEEFTNGENENEIKTVPLPSVSTLTKNQLRRLRKQQAWEAMKATRKQKRKEKKTASKERKKLINHGDSNLIASTRSRIPEKFEYSALTVVIDLSYEKLMNDKEIVSITKQIERCYACNRRMLKRVRQVVTSIQGRVKDRFDTVLPQCKSWDVKFEPEHFSDIFPKKDIVYLTSDSPNILHKIDESKVYILGGLVDRNRYKGITYKDATAAGLETAQLPLQEYITMTSRRVLTINHVFEILLKYMELGDWQKAFLDVLPPRKGALAIDPDGDETDESESSIRKKVKV